MFKTEEELVEGCIKGDRQAQRMLYEQFSGRLYVVCLRYCKLKQEAEDILQEAFIKIYGSLKSFRKESSLWFWMKRIAVNTALNFHRSKLYLYPMVDVQDLNENASPEVSLASFHFKELLELIQELPSGCQIIFNLYAIEGYKHHEIAEMLKISEGTSKSQYARAKKLLQEKLKSKETIQYGGIES